MRALERFNNYISTIHPRIDTHYMKLLLEAIREGDIKQIKVGESIYEVYADILETKE